MSGSLCAYCAVFGFGFVLMVYGLGGLVAGLVSVAFEGGFSGFLGVLVWIGLLLLFG